MAISDALRQMRIRAGLTQTESANALHVDQTAISQWETGITKPRADKFPSIAKLYGCSLEALFSDDDSTKDTDKAV